MVLSQSVPFSATEFLLAFVIFCLMFWVIRAWKPQVPKGLKSPPGPWGWPLIGHVLTLGRNPHLPLTRLSQQYGDVMQVRIGSTPVLVLSGLDTIQQALVQQGDDFKGRPDLYSSTLINDGQSMTFSPDSGPVWAARRRLAQKALNTFSMASDPASLSSCYLEEHVINEAEALLHRLQELMAGAGCFDPYSQVVVSVTNIIGAMCFGQHFPQHSEELLSLIENTHEFVETATSGNPMDFFPFLRYLPSPALQKFKVFNQRFLQFVQKTVQGHYRDFDKNSVQDITGALFKHSEEGSRASGGLMPQKKIINLVNDIFGAGIDTVTTAISWSLMYLMTKPGIQKKIQKELDTVIGKARKPRLSDRPQLPYMEAFILEIFRHSSFVPFTIPHSTTRDTTLNGLYIPKGRCVFVNQWHVNHDQKLWGDPFEFRPERFLTAEGSTINKTLSEKVMLFGMGKRRCIGEVLAKCEIFLFLAILLQQLEFSLPPGIKVDLTPNYGLTMKHARCKHVQAQLRFSVK
ncbi:cytochrome P450 1A2-like [Elephas maximus indicus]|uniref:cytochrome P450 1A2-like n=1 Tax=Elephas maximus indicus TaxID=99487 RepID=UPI002116575A|nr:cytochrome P450 1A2-like [Elephas maximus indicus]